MSLLSVVCFLCLLCLSLQDQTCDKTTNVDLEKNKNWDWPDTNHIEEGVSICYSFDYSSYTYANVNIELKQMGSQDGVWVVDSYGNEYAYGGYVNKPMDTVNYKIMGPPTSVLLGLHKASQSQMKVSKLQIITDNFNPKKKPKESCTATATIPCSYNYDYLTQDNVYRFDGIGGHDVKILAADETTWILVFDSNLNYISPLGHSEPFNSSTIYLYVSWSGASGTVVIAQDDYELPTPPPPPTFPTIASTLPPTNPPTVQLITDPVTEAPILTTQNNNNNNGQPTTVPSQHTTPKMSSRLSVFLPLTTGLAYLLTTV